MISASVDEKGFSLLSEEIGKNSKYVLSQLERSGLELVPSDYECFQLTLGEDRCSVNMTDPIFLLLV
jgi:hypothetical protein